MKRLALFLLLVAAPASSAQDVAQYLNALKPRCIGPANMSGRVCEIAVYEKEPRIQYVASASGGLWKTVNNGTTWKPVYERGATSALGAVAVCQSNPDVVWISGGEANARNSVSWGDGVLRSTDGGKSWQHMGLKATEHIGRIIIHPKSPDIVYVAALGKVWAANKERGVFKTSNAGKTWDHVLALDENTGAIDIDIDPAEPDILYAAMYQVRRGPFSGGNPETQIGPRAGIYKTSDAGKTWQKMTAGLPNRPLGRCGISVHRKNPSIVYAVVQTDKTSVSTQGQAPNEKLDINAGGIFRSDDKGKTWKHLNSCAPRPFYYGQIRVDPNDDQRLYVLGIQLHLSTNGGKDFIKGNRAKGTHGDYHALWIDPRDSHHLILGSDGGVNYSYDKGTTWEYLKNLPVSQFYAVGLDNRKPYRIYGGLQDNGTWGGPSATFDSAGITADLWKPYLGYDGYYCQVHPKDNDILYCEGQYGILRRNNVRIGQSIDIRPRADTDEEKSNINPPLPKGTPDFRFNWSSPILQSPYAVDEIFYAGNVFFVSTDRGDTWQIASPDLTHGKPGPNDLKAHTISTIAASPLEDHVFYAGTDDGRLWVCKDWQRRTWNELSAKVPDVPANRWISRVETSRFAKGTVYLAIDRHRHDDRKPYLFKSTDHGNTWTSIVGNLPADGYVHVIREDPVNPKLLYAGTEYGLFISLDAGKSWYPQKHLPTVPVHDLVVHPRDRELVIATHGRAIWIMDVLPLQESGTLLPIRPAFAYRQLAKQNLGIKYFIGTNPPYGASIYVRLDAKPAQPPVVTIVSAAGETVAELKGAAVAGLQRLSWDVNRPKTQQGYFNPVPAGTYTAVLTIGGNQYRQSFAVEVDQ